MYMQYGSDEYWSAKNTIILLLRQRQNNILSTLNHSAMLLLSLIKNKNKQTNKRGISPFFSMSSTASLLEIVPFSTFWWSWCSPMAPKAMGASFMVLHVSPPSSLRGIFFVKKLTTTITVPLTPKMIMADEKKRDIWQGLSTTINDLEWSWDKL